MQKPWHALSSEEIFSQLKTSSTGLNEEEAKARLERYGRNELKETGKVKWIHILLHQFVNIMVLILIAGMVISVIAGETLDAIAIFVIVLINAGVGFLQEYKAEKAIEALRNMAAPHATVLRGGEVKSIDAKDLVPGDIIILEEGMRIPADARLFETAELGAIEASLTGESRTQSKTIEILPAEGLSLGDLDNMVFLGTVIAKGHGKAVVIATGMQTEFGKIAHLVQSAADIKTPLQIKLNRLSQWLAGLVIVIAILLFGSAWFLGRDLTETLLLSISLAVSVIPEGLPAIITLTLALGVQSLAKNRAIVRKLPAAETLGSTSVICTDKTGTLTQNQMTVRQIYVDGEEITVTGEGYAPEGQLLNAVGQVIEHSPALTDLLRVGALCNNAKLLHEAKRWEITGDPTEGCLLTLARKAGFPLAEELEKAPRKAELIFDSKRKRMSTIHTLGRENWMYTKGAVDGLLEVCTHIYEKGEKRPLTKADKKRILEINETYARKALRVLGFAKKEVAGHAEAKEEDLTFLGLVGVMDPPRKEVKAALATCREAHIQVIMITGDHALTAEAIAREIGLFQDGDQILTGAELQNLNERELEKIVESTRVFARVNPEHKVRILKALQKRGHVVAMTGDGVNDAPALKNADIGVAMGITGTDVSKEASDMILTDDNFATIVTSVERGRIIYQNLKKFVRFLLSANFDEVLLITVTFLLGLPAPFIPIQILWVNLLTDALPAIALGVDTPDRNIMKLKPRNKKASLFGELVKFSLLAGVLSTVISLILYFDAESKGSIEHTRTLMFTTIVIFELLLVFSVRYDHHHYFTNFFKNRLLLLSIVLSLALQMAVIYWAPLQDIFKTVPLELSDWLKIVALCLASIVLIEIWKRFQPKTDHV